MLLPKTVVNQAQEAPGHLDSGCAPAHPRAGPELRRGALGGSSAAALLTLKCRMFGSILGLRPLGDDVPRTPRDCPGLGTTAPGEVPEPGWATAKGPSCTLRVSGGGTRRKAKRRPSM